MKQFMCGGTKYIFGSGYIALPVSIAGLPQKLEMEGRVLSLKSSFHISLICVTEIVGRYEQQTPNLEQEIIKAFCTFIPRNNISLLGYRDEFHYVKDKKRESVVVMCNVSNLQRFFKRLNKKFGIEVATQPTHVTLYTLKKDVGIGLTSLSDIEQKTKLITKGIPFVVKKLLAI